jgi:hypothetical protein
MTIRTDIGGGWQRSPWRVALWIGAAAALIAPALAMRFVDGMAWGPADFAAFAVMLALACGAIEFAMRTNEDRTYRVGMMLAVATAFLLLWANLAVGIVGNEDHPANRMFDATLAFGALGALVSRLRARGMARTMMAMACAQAAVAAIVPLAGWGQVFVICGCLAGIWLLCAWMFDVAAKRAPSSHA